MGRVAKAKNKQEEKRETGRAIDTFRDSLQKSDFNSTKEIRKWRDRNWRS